MLHSPTNMKTNLAPVSRHGEIRRTISADRIETTTAESVMLAKLTVFHAPDAIPHTFRRVLLKQTTAFNVNLRELVVGIKAERL